MARTWTLADTEAVSGYPVGPGTVNSDYNKFYFHTTDKKVYQWDGATLSDISGTYFTSGAYTAGIYGVCWFKGNLYAHHKSRTNAERHDVSVWNGGTSWSVVRQIVNNAGQYPQGDPTDIPTIAADDEVMVVFAWGLIGFPYSSINSTADGSIWSVDQWESSYNTAPYRLFGAGLEGWLNRYSEMIAWDGNPTEFAIRNGGNWQEQSPGPGSGEVLIGHTDDYLFYRDNSSPYTIYRTDKDAWGASPTALATTHSAVPVAIYNVGSDAMMMHLLNQDDAYTWDGSDFVADGTLASPSQWIRSYFRFGTTLYLMAASNGTVRFYSGGTITLFPNGGGDSGRRHLGLAADQVNLYVTGAEDGTLFLEVYDLATLSLARRVTFGEATFEELDDRTRGLWPVVRPGTDGIVYLYGRDGNNVQVQVSDDEGYTFTSLDDDGWADDKFCVGLLIDPLEPTDVAAAFADDDIYRSRLSGATWSKVDDGPVSLRKAARHPVAELDLILAGQGSGAGELFFSPNLGGTSEDISEATMGRVNAIEVSR